MSFSNFHFLLWPALKFFAIWHCAVPENIYTPPQKGFEFLGDVSTAKKFKDFSLTTWLNGLQMHEKLDFWISQFQHRSKIYQRDTKQNNDLTLPKCRLVTGQGAFAFLRSKIFNSLPKVTRDTESQSGREKKKYFVQIALKKRELLIIFLTHR